MRSFGMLLTNEWLKLFKKKSIYVPFAILALFAGVYAYAAFRLKIEISSGAAFAAEAISMGSAGQLLPMLAIIALASMVSKEYRMGTIKLLLIRAHSRNKILASKYIVSLLFTASLIVFTAAAVLITGTIVYGFGGDAELWGQIGKSMLYLLIYTVVYVSLTFMIDVLTKSSGVTVGISLFCIMIGGLVTLLLSKYEFAKYLLFASTDLSQYEPGSELFIEGMSLPFSVSVLIGYTAIFLIASFVTFRKRDVS
ncbi:DUF2705 family protein [Paenibacillus sp. LHD-117]|uniref:ABC transporter permease n=1 Tax=Paenibacillus sp. LHD-117 TaxID=3071412 RepID=UPI0027DF370E|nr:DUF2705 family protein [Paenibacillus sp. LHD-117]MDQ6419084.1 DUF2705 family protein [Paenibacillus sp. LHD-117]